eukprot:237897_1
MAVDLMGAWGDSAGGSFWDDGPDQAGGNRTNDYVQVTTSDDKLGEDKVPNPHLTFQQDEDPDSYMQVFDSLKSDIRKIETNARMIKKLSERYNSSTGKDENQAIMNELDDIMSKNSKYTRQIKGQLVSEKEKNDTYHESHKGSSVAQWRINQLNSCTRRFKDASLAFSQELNQFNATLRDKQKRHIDILDDNKLSEQEKEEMVNDYDRAEAFIQEQFQMVETSDALVDRLAELEDRHQGMIKIEKSIKELQEMWMELNVLVTEQQEMLDHITRNVEETRDYVKSATKHLQKAEENQKCSRKLQMYACCCCLIILVILVIALGAGGIFT